MLLPRFPAGPVPLSQHPANRLMAQVGNPVGGNLPELRVKNLERDVSVIADPPEVIEDRVDLKIAFARQDPVAVAGQLAGGAAQVADLYPGEVVAGKVGQVLELARPGVVVEQVETDAGVIGAALGDQGQRRVQAGAESRGLLELERDPNAETAGQLGRLAEHGGGAAVVFCRGLAREVGRDDQDRDSQLLQDRQPAAEVAPVGLAFVPPREQQTPLPRRRRRHQVVGIKQPAQLVDRMPLEVRFQLGQPELDGPPAAALERRKVGLQRRAQGRGLADAGFHESSRRSVGCLCHHGKMLRTAQRPRSSRANSPAGPVRTELKDSPGRPGPRAGRGAPGRPRRWARATGGSCRGRER